MAKIHISQKLDENGQYVLGDYSIEGEGPIGISYAFMNDADPKYVQYDREKSTIRIGPYLLEIIAQPRSIDGHYLCRLINGRPL